MLTKVIFVYYLYSSYLNCYMLITKNLMNAVFLLSFEI